MDKSEWIISEIKSNFTKEEWEVSRKKLIKKCLKVFKVWVQNKRKNVDLSKIDKRQMVVLLEEWIDDEKSISKYEKEWQDEEDVKFIKCSECVFREFNHNFCLKFAINVDDDSEHCKHSNTSEWSTCFGELYEFLDKLDVKYG